MTMEYIRQTYGVPAAGGARVTYSGGPMVQHGTIMGTKGKYLRIRLDGEARPMNFHPTWKLEYLPHEPICECGHCDLGAADV